MKNNPIGVFDSGVGGVSVLKSIRSQLPHEDLIYAADLQYVPYGDKPQSIVRQRAMAMSQFLLEQDVKAIVVACNTATVNAIHWLRESIHIPIIGIEPGVKPASLTTKTGIIGVLATNRTLESESFTQLVKNWVKQQRVILQPCPGLVEQVESLQLQHPRTRKLLQRYLRPLLSQGADTLVLGCTHYPFLSPLIEQITGQEIQVIDTGPAVAREVQRRLQVVNLLKEGLSEGQETFWSSSRDAMIDEKMSRLWGKTVSVRVFADFMVESSTSIRE